MFEILTKEDLNLRDVWKGFRIGRKHENWWCSSDGWDYDQGAMEGTIVEARTSRVGTVALVSMVKFLR